MIEGKTKIITPLWPGAQIGLVTDKNDITAGDGARHDVIPGKAELATRTTCNVFEYLNSKGVPVAYIGRDGPTTFLTWICEMISVEVVVRLVAAGSYLKRHPAVAKGTTLAYAPVECFYKTTRRKIGDMELPCDDPRMDWDYQEERFELYRPDKPMAEGYIGRLNLSDDDTEVLRAQIAACNMLATDIGVHLSDAWNKLGGALWDFKAEFGVLPNGSIVLADVVDCDSWRVEWNGVQLSKQGYRDGDDLARVLAVYRLAASLTDQFSSG